MIGLASAAASGATDEIPPLNDPASSSRLPGKLVWADLFTTDVAAATKFYTALFGWTASTVARDSQSFTILFNAGQPVAGIVQRPQRRETMPGARWIGYVSVRSVADTLAAATGAGGKVLAPVREFPRRGTQAILADDQGAVLGVLYSSSGDGDDYQPEAGEWIWAQLLARDPDAAATFCRRTFGYEITLEPNVANKGHFVLASGGFARGGIAPLPARDDARPGWVAFVRVASIERTAARATEGGGRVLVAPREVTAGTRFAVLGDPAGAVFGVTEIASDLTSTHLP
jgi:predicted enzyme related to lactoylglutathione lyase